MYEKLLKKAQEENIEIVYKSRMGRLKGLYYNRVIAINKNVDTKEALLFSCIAVYAW